MKKGLLKFAVFVLGALVAALPLLWYESAWAQEQEMQSADCLDRLSLAHGAVINLIFPGENGGGVSCPGKTMPRHVDGVIQEGQDPWEAFINTLEAFRKKNNLPKLTPNTCQPVAFSQYRGPLDGTEKPGMYGHFFYVCNSSNKKTAGKTARATGPLKGPALFI